VYETVLVSFLITLSKKPAWRYGFEEIFMGDNKKENSETLSKEELAKAAELQAEVRRKLSLLLADPRTPEAFKKAFQRESRSIE
jgi:hypothetical protein